MPVNSYANIQALIADALARTDLTNQIIDAITLYEAEAAQELFRTRGTETRTILTPTNPAALSITALADNGSGLVRVTYTGTASPALATNNIVAVAGTNEVDGLWKITVINSTQVDLQGSASSGISTATGTLQQDQGFAQLPSDYLGWRRVTYTGVPTMALEYIAPDAWTDEFPTFEPQVATAIPRVFTIEFDSNTGLGYVKIKPVNTTPLEFVYWQKTPALSASFNWLATNWPNAYVAGALEVLYGLWIKEFDKAAAYKAKKEELHQRIKLQRFREHTNLRIRIDRSSFGATP